MFYAYLNSWDDPAAPLPAEAEVLLANPLPDLEAEVLRLRFPRPDQRPQAVAMGGTLALAQANGISFDQLLDLYAACGDDIRPHLMRD